MHTDHQKRIWHTAQEPPNNFFPRVWNNETAILCSNFFQKKQIYFEQKKNFRHFSNSCLTKLCCIFFCGAALVHNLLGYNYSVCQSKLRYYIIFAKKIYWQQSVRKDNFPITWPFLYYLISLLEKKSSHDAKFLISQLW